MRLATAAFFLALMTAQASLIAETPEDQITIRYDEKTQTLVWTAPDSAPKDARWFLMVMLESNKYDAVYWKIFDHEVSSISVADMNKKTGPMIPTIIDPAKNRYIAEIWPVDADRKPLTRLIVQIEFGAPAATQKAP